LDCVSSFLDAVSSQGMRAINRFDQFPVTLLRSGEKFGALELQHQAGN
jgi:hypothetical protein